MLWSGWRAFVSVRDVIPKSLGLERWSGDNNEILPTSTRLIWLSCYRQYGEMRTACLGGGGTSLPGRACVPTQGSRGRYSLKLNRRPNNALGSNQPTSIPNAIDRACNPKPKATWARTGRSVKRIQGPTESSKYSREIEARSCRSSGIPAVVGFVARRAPNRAPTARSRVNGASAARLRLNSALVSTQ
jgi:hypothetical protein